RRRNEGLIDGPRALQDVVGRSRQLVGALLDAGFERPALLGGITVRQQAAFGQGGDRGVPLLLRPSAALPQPLRRSRADGGGQDVRFDAVQALRGEDGDVAVPAVLPQGGRRLPQGLDRVVRDGEVPVGGEQ